MARASTGVVLSTNGAIWPSAINSSVAGLYAFGDPTKCLHCEEKLTDEQVGKVQYCSDECRQAYAVAQRLGAVDQYPTSEFGMSWTINSTSTSITSSVLSVNYSTNWGSSA